MSGKLYIVLFAGVLAAFVFATPIATAQVDPNCGQWGYLPMDYNEDCFVGLLDLAELAWEWMLCTHPDIDGCEDYRGFSIQRAIDKASPGDTIVVPAGTYTEALTINKDIILISEEGAEATIIDATGLGQPCITFGSMVSSACVVQGLTFANGLGAVAGNDAAAALRDCFFTGNRGTNIFISLDGEITGCQITENTSTNTSAIFLWCDGLIAQNRIEGNTSGAGNSIFAICNGTIENNLLVQNESGAALFVICDGLIRNNTIADNILVNGVTFGGTATYVNNIQWNNTPNTFVELSGNVIIPAYCDVQGYAGAGSNGNIDADPMFADPNTGGDYHLLAGSPCIDAADIDNAPLFDFESNPREPNELGGPDIGAYEYGIFGDIMNITQFTSHDTIQRAVDAAIAGDEIIIKSGTYAETLTIDKDIVLRSEGKGGATVVDASGLGLPSITFGGGVTSACVIQGLTFANGTGAVVGNAATATIKDCVISGSSGTHTFLDYDGDITGCTIEYNTSTDSSAIFVLCDGRIAQNRIENNIAGPWNSVIAVCNGTIENNLFVNNEAGAAMFVLCDGLIRNNTIADNTLVDGVTYGGLATYVNNIQWNNTLNIFKELSGNTISPTNCNVEGYAGAGSNGNIDADPLFLDPENGNYDLGVGSPCIDAGDAGNAPAEDYAGTARDANPDIGAYEFDGPYFYVTNTTTGEVYSSIQGAIDAAAVGDVVEVSDGTYNESLLLSQDITLRSANGADSCTINATTAWALTFGGGETSACVVEGFTLTGGGGCINGNSTGAMVANCVITGFSGGHTILSFHGTLFRNEISSNFAPTGTALIVISDCDIIGNVITDNNITDSILFVIGAGLVENNLIFNNSSAGIFYDWGGTIRNNTVVYNPIFNALCWGGTGAFVNNIIWGNDNSTFSTLNGATTIPEYCDIDNYAGGTNFSLDPMFVDPNSIPDGFALKPGSPCIDSGDASNAAADDFYGNIRDATPDVGAFEF